MIGQKAALMLANMVVGTVLGLVAAILVGRFFEPMHVGQLTYTLNLLGLLFFVTDLGMGQAHVKRVSEGRDPGDCFATYAVFKLVATTVFVSLVAAGVVLYHGILGKPLEDTTLPIILVIVAYYVAKSLADVGQSSFDARLETAKSQLAHFLDTLLRVGLTIYFALVMAVLVHRLGPLVGRVPGTEAFAWVAREPGLALAIATAVGAFVAAVVSLTLLFRTLEWGRFRWSLLKDYASFAFPLFISSSIVLFSSYIDGAALGFFRGDEDAGIFGAIRRLPLVLAGLGTMLSALLFPAISAMVARGDREGVERTANGALRYLSILLVPAVAFAAVFPVELLHITLGDKWLAGAPALALLSVGVLITTLGHTHAFLLLGYDRARSVAKVGIAAAIVLIALNLLLVPKDIKSLGIPLADLGVTGAAIATVVSSLTYYLGLRFASRRLVGYQEKNRFWLHALAALVMCGSLYLLHAFVWPLARWFHVLAYIALGGALYLLVLRAAGELTSKDLDFVKRTLHVRDMMRYIRGEIRERR